MNPLGWLIGLLLPACGFGGAGGVKVPQPMDFAHIEFPSTPNAALVGPAGMQPAPHIVTPVYPVAAPVLQAALREVAAGQRGVFPLAAYPERGQMFWVARSAVFNFPDVVAAEIRPVTPGESSLVLYSRSLYGSSDLGVNRQRLVAWIAALDRRLAGAPRN